MASTQQFIEDNGPAGGTPARGATQTTGISNMNFGSVDSANIVVANSVITGGTNSYDKFISCRFSGTYNTLLNAKWQHVSGNFGAGFTLKATVSGSGFYTTPSQATNANLVRDLTSSGLASTGLVVPFLSTGSYNNDYALTTSVNPAFTPFLIHQLQTTAAAAPGDLSETLTFSLTWDES